MSEIECSVIIPTYKRPLLLGNAIKSVCVAARAGAIDLRTVELVIVDDAHQESAAEVCRVVGNELGISVRYMKSEGGPSAGPSKCRTQGVRASFGQWIYLLDDDDEFLPSRFVASINLLRAGEANAVCETSLRVPDDPRRMAFITGPSSANATMDPYTYFLCGDEATHITPAATSFSRGVFKLAGGWDAQLRHGEDGEFLMRLSLHGRLVLMAGAPVCRIRVHTASHATASRLAYWQPMKCLHRHFSRVGANLSPQHKSFLVTAIRGKFDFALTRIRLESPSRAKRIEEGLKVLRWMPVRLITWANMRSIAVWLVK